MASTRATAVAQHVGLTSFRGVPRCASRMWTALSWVKIRFSRVSVSASRC